MFCFKNLMCDCRFGRNTVKLDFKQMKELFTDWLCLTMEF